MSKKYFLITTALEETWVVNRPVLFLGEWCKLYARKKKWETMDAETSPYHWDDRERFFSDYLRLNDLYERALSSLTKALNTYHGTHHSVRYWRILAGPWLAYFIQILMDRWLSIRYALDNHHIDETIVLTGAEEKLIANDMNQFIGLCIDDVWNHLMYSEILRRIGGLSFIYKKYTKHIPEKKGEQKKLKHFFAEAFSKVTSYFVRQNDVFINKPYLTAWCEFCLSLRLGQVPQYWETVAPVSAPPHENKRNWTLDIEGSNEFEKLLLSLLPKLIPTVYLEGYGALMAQVKCLRWPKNPKAIYTSNVLWHDTVSMAYIAEKTENGSLLVYGQHGGAYWTAKFTHAEDHELKICDRYLSWGWSDEALPSLIPVGMSKIRNRQKFNANKNEQLLLITLSLPRYSYRLASEDATNSLDYIESSFNFTELLDVRIRDNLLVRLAPGDAGLGLGLRWADRFPMVKTNNRSMKIYRLMRESRVVVSTYNQTSFLETIFMNIPTILFIDTRATPLRASAVPYFVDLKRVGIFHESPDSAAEHLNKIWDDVNAWWLSEDLQMVLGKFSDKFCKKPENIINQIKSVFNECINHSN